MGKPVPTIQVTVHEMRDDTAIKGQVVVNDRAVTFDVKSSVNGLEITDKESKFLLVVSVFEGKVSVLGWDENAKPEEPTFIHELASI